MIERGRSSFDLCKRLYGMYHNVDNFANNGPKFIVVDNFAPLYSRAVLTLFKLQF